MSVTSLLTTAAISSKNSSVAKLATSEGNGNVSIYRDFFITLPEVIYLRNCFKKIITCIIFNWLLLNKKIYNLVNLDMI